MDVQFRKWPRRNRDGRKSSEPYHAIASLLTPWSWYATDESKGLLAYRHLVYRNRKRPGVNNTGKRSCSRKRYGLRIRHDLLRNPRQRATLVTIIELPATAGNSQFRRIASQVRNLLSFSRDTKRSRVQTSNVACERTIDRIRAVECILHYVSGTIIGIFKLFLKKIYHGK